MYRLFLSLFLCCVSVWALADPWGVLDDNAFRYNQPEKTLSALISKTLLPQLLERRTPLYYCVEGTPYPEEYAALLEQAYTTWFSSTAHIIRETQRTEEFADLLPFLEKPLLFERQACSESKELNNRLHSYLENGFWETDFSPRREQLRFIVVPPEAIPKVCPPTIYAKAVACEVSQNEIGWHIVLMSQDKDSAPAQWFASLLHELGHTLGMGEGYVWGMSQNSPFFGTTPRKGTLMDNQIDVVQKFSCDEADAMVIFADSISVDGKPARTGQTARRFQSFCTEKPIWYEDGRPQDQLSRATGDSRRFWSTSFEPDGRVKQFMTYTPQLSGFADSFRLTEEFPSSSHSAGSMTYYVSQDGRTFVSEDLEGNSHKRIFTLRGESLLGQTILARYSNMVRASTILNTGDGKKSLVRVENLLRAADSPYGISFIYTFVEGEAEGGKLRRPKARQVYLFKDWMLLSFIDLDDAVITALRIEKNTSGKRQTVQAYQQDRMGHFVSEGKFVVGANGVKQKGDLSMQDIKYLKNFASQSSKQMDFELTSLGEGTVSVWGENVDIRLIKSEQIYSWLERAVKLYSDVESAVKNHLDESPFFTEKHNFSADLKTLFRPSLPMQGLNQKRHRK